jgi:cytochrome c-type biogenesis protein CcmF
VPFAFAVAALITNRLDEEWVVATRRWVLFAWMFLSIGNVLGMLWAYEELGWGGFWAWDPVENAACLPWWTLTAYLHSVMTQERRGILKVWNVSLLLGTFFLTIFGTFLTRSGLISRCTPSRRAASASTSSGTWACSCSSPAALVVWRLPALRRPAQIRLRAVSREAMFVANNWLLLGICVFIALATTWPKVSEWLWSERLTVGASFYNAWLAPVGCCSSSSWRWAPSPRGARRRRSSCSKPSAAPSGRCRGALHVALRRRVGFPAVVSIDPIYDNVTVVGSGSSHLFSINVGRTLAWVDGHLPAHRHRPLRDEHRRPRAGVLPRHRGAHAREGKVLRWPSRASSAATAVATAGTSYTSASR